MSLSKLKKCQWYHLFIDKNDTTDNKFYISSTEYRYSKVRKCKGITLYNNLTGVEKFYDVSEILQKFEITDISVGDIIR